MFPHGPWRAMRGVAPLGGVTAFRPNTEGGMGGTKRLRWFSKKDPPLGGVLYFHRSRHNLAFLGP